MLGKSPQTQGQQTIGSRKSRLYIELRDTLSRVLYGGFSRLARLKDYRILETRLESILESGS